jgi:SAM-dependent methyltransferase
MIDRLKAIGVDEVACLIDFGVDFDSVMSSLYHLNTVRERSNERTGSGGQDYSLPAQIRRHQVSHLQCTPSLARMLAADPGTLDSLRSLRKLMLGGEALPVSLARQLQGVVSGQIHNMYGPTETTIWSTTYPVRAVIGAIPIGRPIANTQIYILDPHLQPVPVGIPGELYIGGTGVVRGYLNRQDLTAERFIANPFSDEPGARLYKTGDLARYLPDGNLEFLGRLDHQAKMRGHRIELGEIETALGHHPAVRETVVLAREDEPGDQRLVAYVVPQPPSSPPEEHRPGQNGHGEPISQWQTIWERTYAQSSLPKDPTFHTIGWNSGYTGQPIPDEEMREWVDHTVARILAWRPCRVLEIGCGTGLLLFRLAPHCTQYWGADFSPAALAYLQQQLQRREPALPQVHLLQRTADDFGGIRPGSFEAVVLNSVAQYFPSIDYLLRVLEGAVRAVEPGGFIFVGDVRSLPLLAAYHASVALHQAPPSLSKRQFQQRVQWRMQQEEELVIDPAFFLAL